MTDVDISLTNSEALVLFEMFSRYSDKGTLGTQDQSEQRALWNLHAALEKRLVAPFQPEYAALLQAARDDLRDDDGTNAQYEQENGRLAFWLAPEDIEFVVNEWRKMPSDAPAEDRRRWADIAFRAMSALDTAGIDYDSEPPAVRYREVPRGDGELDASLDLHS